MSACLVDRYSPERLHVTCSHKVRYSIFHCPWVLLGHPVAPAHLVNGGELSARCECMCKSKIRVWVQCSSSSVGIAAVR